MNEMLPAPETADEMIVRWAIRDAEYAKQRTPLTPETIDAIRASRLREVELMPVADRGRLWAKAKTWAPPLHPDFGSLHSWLEEE